MNLSGKRAFLVLCALFSTAMCAFAGDPSYYIKKGGWRETMIASREALMKQEALRAERLAKAGKLPPEVGPMYSIGPFRYKNQRGFAHAFPPEKKKINLNESFGDLRWRARPDWPGGESINLRGGSHASTYVCRKITVSRPMTISGEFACDDYQRVWLNGKELVTNHKVSTPPDKCLLKLVKGANHLLMKCVNRTGGYSFSQTLSLDSSRDNRKASARKKLWKLIRRDFDGARERYQMSLEQRDNIWAPDWTLGDVKAIASRYAAAVSVNSMRKKARRLAGGVKSPSDLEVVTKIYYAARAREEVQAAFKQFNPAALRRAVKDLNDTFGSEYPNGDAYLKRLDDIEERVPEIIKRMGRGDDAAMKQARELASLRREALLANPLLDFDKLMFVRRRANRMGLPQNWQGNASISRNGYDNEIDVLSPVRPEGTVSEVFKPEGGRFVGDIELHFDGDRFLFSMPGERNRWQVFELGVDGKGLRQITPDDQKDVDNFDACYLPDGRFIYCSTACFQGVPCVGGGNPVSLLYQIDANGENVRQLTFDQDHSWCPTVLNNGRIIYSRWEYSDTPHYFTRMLFHMNPDGTEQMEYYGSNSYWPNSIFYARPIPNERGKVAAIVSGHHGVPRMGELVIFDPAKGRHEADGVVQRIPGYGEKVEPIIRDQLVNPSWPKFLHPYPLSEKYFLVSCKMTPKSQWGIYLVDVFDNMLPLRIEEGYALLEPTPIQKRPAPPVIPDKVDLSRKDCLVYLADVYSGKGLEGVPRGTVKDLRVFEFHYAYNGMGGHINIGIDGPWDVHRILGTVPVRPDGSAMFRAPANTPIAIQPMDSKGRAVQVMRSWMTGMPGETLSCVGCHERQNTSPPLRQTRAAKAGPAEIDPWFGKARGFSFKREVQPVLEKYCVGCHNGEAKNRPNFASTKRGWRGFTESYLALHPYVRRPGPESDYHQLQPAEYYANTSELVQKLRKGHHGVELDEEAWSRIYTWIDLNVPDHGSWSGHRGKIGNVHERRLKLRKRYASVSVDPEAFPSVQKKPDEFIKPKPSPKPPKNVKAAGWPFNTDEAARRQKAAGPPRREIELGDVKMELVLIPAGEFVMGNPAGADDEVALARVKIEEPFWMGKTEVTNAQYGLFDPAHDSSYISMYNKDQGHRGHDAAKGRQPVIRVNWQQAKAFCEWLSSKTGETFTLPTEAQWEYACRAGTDTPMYYGSCDTNFSKLANMADTRINSLTRRDSPNWIPSIDNVNDGVVITGNVGRYSANPWGLQDMHGNVSEWTLSSYRPYPYKADDGRNSGDEAGEKVARGGSFYDRPKRCRSGFRTAYPYWQIVFNTGFRVICEYDPDKVAAVE